MAYTQNVPGKDDPQTTRIDYPGDSAGVSSSLRCHPGAVREENQDCVGRVETPLGELFLVLDGVGGRSGGARASSLGLAEYARFVAGVPAASDPADVLAQATQWVNRQLEDAKRSGPPEMQEMASTVALVLLHKGTAWVGHIGDSRVYRMRGEQLELLTRDHSVVQRMIAQGILTEEQAASHPSSHILTRSLGQPDAALELSSHALQAGDVMLICSDGLWSYSAIAAIERELAAPAAGSAAIADALLQLALAGEAGDNIGLVVLRVGEALQPPAKPQSRSASRFGRGQLYLVLAIAVLLAGAAVYLFVSGNWSS